MLINRRHAFQRDPDVDYRHLLAEIRRLTGYGTAELCFILNVPRSTLGSWETRGSIPNAHDGKAIEKFHASLHPPEPSGIPAR